MSIPVVTFFNNKDGVGKTSLVYHLSLMFAEFGKQVVAIDLDPQSNLTAAFLDEDKLEALWENPTGPTTVFRALQTLTGGGDLHEPILCSVAENLHLFPGDVSLADFEESLSNVWPESMGDTNLYRPFRILTAFWQIAQLAAQRVQADLILVDVGSNLGAINRSALIGSDYVVIPLGTDLFSLQSLQILGPTIRSWRNLWRKRLDNWQTHAFALPQGHMIPLGYIIQQHSGHFSRPVKAYDHWVNRIPGMYHESVLGEVGVGPLTPATDPHCLATLTQYRSLVPMAQDARKPIFRLTPADGAIGSHAVAVQEGFADFQNLARRILSKMAGHLALDLIP
jgi:chromosome partitioning protein